MTVILSAQQAAIDPTISCWVGASAGTGKTKVLVDRLARLLLEGYPPEKLLCITFTKAAATEMQHRLFKKLQDWAVCDLNLLKEDLTNLLGLVPSPVVLKRAQALFFTTLDTPGGLKIQTIHSFCQALLQRFPLEAGLDPSFELITEETAAQMIFEAQQKVFSSLTPSLEQWLDFLTGEISDTRFEDMLQSLHHQRGQFYYFLNCYPDLDRYRHTLEQFLNKGDNTLSGLSDSLLQDIAKTLEQHGSPADQKMGITLQQALKNNKDYSDLLLTKEGTIRQRLASPQFKDKFPELYYHLQQAALYQESRHQHLKNKRIIDLSLAFVHIAKAIFDTYQNDKSQRGLLDFEDLIATTNYLLQQPEISDWIFYKLEGGFEHILIDEAQDTSPAQWQVMQQMLTLLLIPDSPHRTLFIVGDIKQSIYSFQGAKPLLFASLQPYFQQQLEIQNRPWRSINLHLSFRTTAAILTLVDHVFNNNPQGVQFYESIQHLSHRDQEPGLVEIWPLIEASEVEVPCQVDDFWPLPLEQKDILSPGAQLAHQIAEKIQALLASDEVLPSTGQTIRPKDILILVRRRADWLPVLLQHLKQRDIPVAGADRLHLKDHIAVLDLLALGHFLCLPQDDYSLACLLKSPLFEGGKGLKEEDLFTLCHGRESSLWQSLQDHQEHKPVFKQAVTFLKFWLAKVDYENPFSLYHGVLRQTEKFFVSRLGSECQDVLHEFLHQALIYQHQQTVSLQGFIDFITHQETDIKRSAHPHNDQIRFMTIHGAKGLQAPVVILADSGDHPTLQNDLFLWHEADNPLFLLKPSQANETKAILTLKKESLEKHFQEQRRLLYVALTRPQDRLYIAGMAKRSGAGDWYKLLTDVLKDIGTPTTEGGWYYQPLPFKKAPSSKEDKEQPITLPAWLTTPPSDRELWITNPSSPVAEPPLQTLAQQRGIVIHQLFEVLSQVPLPWNFEQLDYTAQQWRKKQEAPLPLVEEDVRRVIEILLDPQYQIFFGPQSAAEVEVNTGDFFGRIDRLALSKNTVFILDYKTSKQIPKTASQIDSAYRQQLATYRYALEKIYNNYQIRTFLLWTEGPELMEIL